MERVHYLAGTTQIQIQSNTVIERVFEFDERIENTQLRVSQFHQFLYDSRCEAPVSSDNDFVSDAEALH